MDTTDDDNYYKCMIATFRTSDFKILLTSFGRHRRGHKAELHDRVVDMLVSRPPGLDRQLFLSKIQEIYQSILNQNNLSQNDNIISPTINQQQIIPTSMQVQPQPPMYPEPMYPEPMYPEPMYPEPMYSEPMYPEPMYSEPMYPEPMFPAPMFPATPLWYYYQPPLPQQPSPPQYSDQPQKFLGLAGLPQIVPQMQSCTYGGNIPRNNNYQNIHQVAVPQIKFSKISRAPLHQQPNRVAPDPVHNTNSSNTRNNKLSIPPPIPLANIKLKKLPFFRVIDECIKLTTLHGSERCTEPINSKGMREVSVEFTLFPHQVNQITENRDTEGKIEFIYQTQIRICRLEAGSTEISDYMPLGLHIRINNKFCPLPPKPPLTRPGSEPRRIARPINCTHQLKLTPCRPNKITINWLPDREKYVFSLHLVEQLSPDTLLKMLKEKTARSADETKNLIIKKLRKSDQDVATMSFHFSLKCPLSQMRMKIPAKSLNCDHFACFDAETFILLNEKKPTWVCPICSKPCLYDDIEIQNYFLEIFTNPKLTDCHEAVELLSDGTWRICEINKNKNLKTSKKKTIASMSLVDSDDDSLEDFLQMDKGVKKSENLKLSCIDLTNNDANETTKKDIKVIKTQSFDFVQPMTIAVDKKSQVEPQQAVTNLVQCEVIEIDSI